MMSTFSRLTQVNKAAAEILLNDNSRFIFFSDCHRGDNSVVDDFAQNRTIFTNAMNYYYGNGYTYIEVGDGDELWGNDHFSTLFNAHKDVYLLLKKFHCEGRFYMIQGNHDIYKCRQRYLKKNLYTYYDPKTNRFEPLFDNIRVHEGLILKYVDTPYQIFVVHGHQGDLFNDQLWPLSRFLVRYVWRYFDLLKNRNPVSPVRNVNRMDAIETNINQWVRANNQMVIAGHTHHAVFPKPGEIPYFNDGCCVQPGIITGIEIQNGEIMLVSWTKKTNRDKTQMIERKVIAGPEKIKNFYEY